MPDIKTKEVGKRSVKAIDKAAVAGERMRTAFVRTKDHAQNLSNDGHTSPSEYAEDQIKYATEDIVQDTGHEIKRTTDKAIDKAREAHRQHKQTKTVTKETQKAAKRTTDTIKEVERGSVRVRRAQNRTIKASNRATNTIKQTAKSTGQATVKTAKGTVKTTQKAVKTAQQTSKAVIKTAEATAKATKAAAQASAKAAKAAAAAAKATAKAIVVAAKVAAKAVAAAVKAIIAAAKALVAAIAAGGWVAVVVIVVICLIAALVACFGIFFSSEDTGSSKTMQVVVQEINQEYQAQIDSIKASVTYDMLEMSGSMAVWPDVLSVYSVKVTTDPNNPQEAATINDEKEQLLRDIFWEMNRKWLR